MKFAVVTLLGTLFSFVAATPVQNGKDVGKIVKHKVNDVVLSTGKFSYVVYLEIKWTTKPKNGKQYMILTATCGGVIIKPGAILTAAHCIGDPKEESEIFAWAGVVDIEKEEGKGQRIRVKNYKQHEGFVDGYKNRVNLPNDIAILFLEKPFKYDGKYITEAILPEPKWNVEKKRGWTVGWGVTENGETSNMLQKTTLRVISQQDCKPYFKSRITDKVICLISDSKTSIISFGDSGGPFVVQSKVVGLSSFVLSFVKKNKKGEDVDVTDAKSPVVFTDVSKYIDWINNTLEMARPLRQRKTKSRN